MNNIIFGVAKVRKSFSNDLKKKKTLNRESNMGIFNVVEFI